jgi:hypothetical protein
LCRSRHRGAGDLSNNRLSAGPQALRDFGLLLDAIALSRLATKYDPRPMLWGARGH